ncbi:MAG: NAD(P)/FAD-dependent oxidoreductase [Gemmatimonadota bacterium]|nr:NAD(P)/FAD-dependent oxidoreductase [Gemmatimonadota bacterium]
MSDADVIVVGGGPAGASTAWALAKAGADVLILDRAHFPRDKPCAEYLSPEASRILAKMGVLDACEAAGAAHLAGMIVRSPNGAEMRGDFLAQHGFRGFRDWGLALRRVKLDAIILDSARTAGARVGEGARVTDLISDSRGAVIGVRTLESGGITRDRMARIVVGADGLRSIVARKLGVTHTARTPHRFAFVSHFTGIAGMGDCGEMHLHRDGYIGLADVGGGVTNVGLVVPFKHARGAAGDPAAFMDAWIAARPHLVPRFASATRVTAVRTTGPFASRARRVAMPGAALVGDAADFFDPFTGEGIFAALRGGELLAPAIIESLAASNAAAAMAALERYDASRRTHFGGKWKVERLVGHTIASPWLADRAIGVLSRRKDLVDLLVGVGGDFIPAETILRPSFVLGVLLGGIFTPRRSPPAAAIKPAMIPEPDVPR